MPPSRTGLNRLRKKPIDMRLVIGASSEIRQGRDTMNSWPVDLLLHHANVAGRSIVHLLLIVTVAFSNVTAMRSTASSANTGGIASRLLRSTSESSTGKAPFS